MHHIVFVCVCACAGVCVCSMFVSVTYVCACVWFMISLYTTYYMVHVYILHVHVRAVLTDCLARVVHGYEPVYAMSINGDLAGPWPSLFLRCLVC